MSARLYKLSGLFAAALGVALVVSAVQSLVGDAGIPIRLFIVLAVADAFLGQVPIMMLAGQKIARAVSLNEARRSAAYMKGVRDTLVETGLVPAAAGPCRAPVTTGSHLRRV